MKAIVYSPYWNTLGGGEYYAASVAVLLSQEGYDVEVLSPDPDLLKKLTERFNLHFGTVSVNIKAYADFTGSLFSKWKLTKQYDCAFFVSDGSIPWLFTKKNIIHFQVPFKNVGGKSFMNRMKMSRIHSIICNSNFTKSVIDQEFGCSSSVVYPAVNAIGSTIKKEKIILSVGRFDGNPKGKRQDVLIEAFTKAHLPDWKLVLIGGVVDANSLFLTNLKKKAEGQAVSIIENASGTTIREMYQKASLYWHAHGYGTDMVHNPWDSEHFGIAIVEAMSAGAIPLAFNAGGVAEIIDESCGYVYTSIDELLLKTKDAIKKIDDKSFVQKCIQKSQQFSKGVFDEKFKKSIS
jgi:glycosyltransferase involved in cell wall biosynthesis